MAYFEVSEYNETLKKIAVGPNSFVVESESSTGLKVLGQLSLEDVLKKVNEEKGWRPASPTSIVIPKVKEKRNKVEISKDQLLEYKKQSITATVDKNTSTLINHGFSFKGAVLSSSETAQSKWAFFLLSKDALSYPFTVSTKDNSGTVEISSAAELEQALAALAAHVQGYLNSGTLLKKRVAEATSQAELDAIVDDRT